MRCFVRDHRRQQTPYVLAVCRTASQRRRRLAVQIRCVRQIDNGVGCCDSTRSRPVNPKPDKILHTPPRLGVKVSGSRDADRAGVPPRRSARARARQPDPDASGESVSWRALMPVPPIKRPTPTHIARHIGSASLSEAPGVRQRTFSASAKTRERRADSIIQSSRVSSRVLADAKAGRRRLTKPAGRVRINRRDNRMPSPDVTSLLQAWSGGDSAARDQLMTLVYDELRRRADGVPQARAPRPHVAADSTGA